MAGVDYSAQTADSRRVLLVLDEISGAGRKTMTTCEERSPPVFQFRELSNSSTYAKGHSCECDGIYDSHAC